jgi:hypothetical protein
MTPRRALTPEQRIEIAALRLAHPTWTLREIGAVVGCGPAAVCNSLSGRTGSDMARKPDCVADHKPEPYVPPITVQQPGSIIRPLSMACLMAGNSRLARRSRI